MSGAIQNYLIRGFKGVSSMQESTHLGTALRTCKNILLRPWGGIKSIPTYERLWALGASQTIDATFRALNPPAAKAIVKNTGASVLSVFQNFLRAGEIVRLTTSGSFPSVTISGSPHTITGSTDYYIRNLSATECALSTSPSGALLVFTTAGTGTLTLTPQRTLDNSDGTIAVRLAKHGKQFLLFYNLPAGEARSQPFYLGDDGSYTGTVDFTSSGATLEVLSLGWDATARWHGVRLFSQIHLHNGVDTPAIVQLNRSAIPGKWRPSGHNDRPAAPVVSLQAPSSATNVQAFWTIAGGGGANQRTGTASLTFTANATNFPGAAGNNRIYVKITYNPYGSRITSTLSGAGTAGSPYVYTINTAPGAAQNSTDAIVAYVNTDSKVISILTASKSAADSTADTQSWAQHALADGSGTGTSTGWANRTVTVYARYWDEGEESLGYEGISSDLSNTVIIDALSANDIVVNITKNPAAGGGRFRAIRLYLQFGEDAAAIWSLVDPDNPIDNTTSGTATVVIGSDTPFGQTMYVDQHQALPNTCLTQCKGQIWRGGNPDYPSRIYVSKPATEDEMAPEGANVEAYELLQSSGSVGGNRVTAMYSDNYRVHVHTPGAVALINPADPLDQFLPPSVAGAINPTALVQWSGANQYYLGSDLQLYLFNSTRYGQNDSTSAAQDAAAYVIERVDRTAVQNHPERVFMFADFRGQMIWYFAPSLAGPLIGFAYDFLAKGLVGEFEYPKIYGLTAMEPSRPEFIFTDEDGNLFVWDTSDQDDTTDALPSQAAFTPHTTPDTAPVGQAGYGHVTWSGQDYRQAVIAELETGLIDMSQPATRKQLTSLIWTTIANSRAQVEVTITTKAGQTITRTYGDVGEFGNGRSHKLLFSVLDTAAKVKLRILSAEQKTWIIRDLALTYRAGRGV